VRSRGTVSLAVLLVLLALVAGCTSSSGAQSSGSDPSSAAPRTMGRYVALGDSYTAGPLVPTTDLAGGCARSDHNYPHLVAAALDVHTLVDVSCSGASTADLTEAQHPFQGSTVPPQLRAVDRRTTLVTLGIGGNDLDLFATLIGTCTRLRRSDPGGTPCRDYFAQHGPDLDRAFTTIATNVTAAVRAVRHKAPDATVVLVGYLRLVPDRGTCVALPLATGDYAEGRRITRGLNAALERAAKRTDVPFVDMYAASHGHDACSADPWVNGSVTDRAKALAYHPFAAGMRAAARQVVAAVERSRSS